MNKELLKIYQALQQYSPDPFDTVSLYPGIGLSYLKFETKTISLRHEPLTHIMQINYCRSGRMSWQTENGKHVCLGPGDFSLHIMKNCAASTLTFPTGAYEGLMICIDLEEAAENPPEPLENMDIFRKILPEKFCRSEDFTSLAGDLQTDAIFSGFYGQPADILFPYQKVKTLELLLYLAKMEHACGCQISEYQSEQVNQIRGIHDYLLEHMDQRITIRDLSRQFLMNPTTLKNTFKSVYGMSIASHIKEHRMTYAAKMLRESDMSIAEIAQYVGYDSQSRFSDAFKTCYHILPTEYRRQSQSSGTQTP